MALRGSIDDVPIVDVLQFVHLSGKSGTLALTSERGPAWVEFSHGNIVFARGPSTRTLGELLVESGALGASQVARAIERQRQDPARPALGRILLADKVVTAEKLAECVRGQIHEAMMDIANWRTGDFQFDQGNIEVVDDTRVDVAEVLPLLKLNTQFLLFEAVRLFDERQREQDVDAQKAAALAPTAGGGRPASHASPPAASSAKSGSPLAPGADLLFPALPEGPATGPRIVGEPTLPPPGRDAISLPEDLALGRSGGTAGILLVGFEKVISPVVSDALTHAGYRVLGHVPRREIERQFLGERRWPHAMVLLWRVHGEERTGESLASQLAPLERVATRHPGWSTVALVSRFDAAVVGRVYGAGARATLPIEPSRMAARDSVIEGLLSVVGQIWRESARNAYAQAAELRAWVQAKRVTAEMQRAMQKASIGLELMRVAANAFERATLFLAKDGDLIGLGAFGLTSSGAPMAESLRGLALKVDTDTPLSRCLVDRSAFVGPTRELGLGQLFFDIAGRPALDRGVLVPLVGSSRAIGVLYGDNGARTGSIRGIHAIEIAAAQAGIAYENVLLRMRLDGNRIPKPPEAEEATG